MSSCVSWMCVTEWNINPSNYKKCNPTDSEHMSLVIRRLKCICTRKILFGICERDTFPKSINGSERTLEKTTACLHCLQGITGNYIYLVTILIVSSQTLYFEMYYFITWWTFFSQCWCNGLLNCVPFTYKKNCGVQVHFNSILLGE